MSILTFTCVRFFIRLTNAYILVFYKSTVSVVLIDCDFIKLYRSLNN